MHASSSFLSEGVLMPKMTSRTFTLMKCSFRMKALRSSSVLAWRKLLAKDSQRNVGVIEFQG